MQCKDQDLSPRWAGTTAEQRRNHMRMARLSAAVKAIVDHWPQLTEAQKELIRDRVTPTEGR